MSSGVAPVAKEKGSAEKALTNLIEAMIAKVDSLSKQISSMKVSVNAQSERIRQIENIHVESEGNRDSSSAAETSVRSPKDRADKVKSKSKLDRVNIEKERQYQVLLQSLYDNERREHSTVSESQETVSEEDLSSKQLKKKVRRSKVSANGKKSDNVVFIDPSDSSDPESSDTGSDKGKRRRGSKKVKSGAKVKKRPVVRTELWPHTIANEEGVEDAEVTSDNISYSAFVKYFTKIIVKCEKAEEAMGRSVLLSAVSTVVQCLSWKEARGFHNSIMVKIEQDRLNWDADFAALGDKFLDEKVRLSLRSRGTSSGYKPADRNSNYRSFGRGYNGSYPNSYSRFGQEGGKMKILHTLICHQWNAGSCSYGVNCKRWHCCKACADMGKIGEPHMASTHDRDFSRSKQSEQRV